MFALITSTAAMTALGTATSANAADSDPLTLAEQAPAVQKQVDSSASKLRGIAPGARGAQTVFVQFTGAGTADVAQQNKTNKTDLTKVRARRTAVTKQSNEVLATAKADDAQAAGLYTTSNALPGIVLRTDRAGIAAVAARDDVVKVSRIVRKHVTNANTAALTRAYDTWKYANGLGKGVRIGIIDTGIDYTHKDFGGPGTVAAYRAAKAASASPTWRNSLPALGKAKIAGGVDFVGDSYNPDETLDDGSDNPDFDPVAKPDKNPLDCNEHGTHVSGTAAGYGVNANGSTFTGNYANLTKPGLLDMRVGPGMAPAAQLYGLKVFGCEGATDHVLEALDWSLDPNGDGNFSDHLDILNISLGSDDDPADDPENAVIDELTSHGVLSVIAAGNNGDLTDTTGSPANAVSSLAVANSVDSYQLRDGLKVTAPSTVAGMVGGQTSEAYDWAANGPTKKPVSGTVATVPGANADGCDPFSAADQAKVKGKVAWLEWDDNDASRRCGSAVRAGNAREAGAIGALFTSGTDVFSAGITGDPTIPVLQLTKTATDKLRASAQAGTLKVTFDGQDRNTIKDIDNSITDTLSTGSSRGVHGSYGVVKPDVTAPGSTIASAGMGSGSAPLVISGTSMSSPLAAGISALVKARHPGYTPQLLKASVMNTAGNDLWTKPDKSGFKYGPARVGAGRVDALRAVSAPVLAWSPGANKPVSASFGVVPVPASQPTATKTRPLNLLNTTGATTKYRLTYQPVITQPGVSYTVSPASVTLKGYARGSATVTMHVTTSALRHTIDPTMEKTQQVGEDLLARQYVADASGRVLVTPAGGQAARVPVYGAAKPVSTTVASVKAGAIALTGKGFKQGSGSTGWTSLTSVLQLGQTSKALPTCDAGETAGCVTTGTERSGDLQYVGAGSVGDRLWFGLSSYGNWANIGTIVQPYVDFDTTGDGEADYETFVTRGTATDVMLAVTIELTDFTEVDVQPVNFNYGDVDTNVFDTNVLTLPVLKSALTLRGTSKPISYTVGTFSGYTGEDIDTVGPVAFNVGNPTLRLARSIYPDAGGTTIDYAVTGTKPIKALVLHLHGANGKRAQVLDLPAPKPKATGSAKPGLPIR